VKVLRIQNCTIPIRPVDEEAFRAAKLFTIEAWLQDAWEDSGGPEAVKQALIDNNKVSVPLIGAEMFGRFLGQIRSERLYPDPTFEAYLARRWGKTMQKQLGEGAIEA
jgi:hypothetical protein